MNTSKKIIKNQGIGSTKKTRAAVKQERVRMLLFLGVAAVAVVMAVGFYEWLKPKLLLTVNDTKLYEEDLMYDIFTQEQMGASYSSAGFDFWNQDLDQNGQVQSEDAKNSVMMAAEQREVLYQEAMMLDYELTDEENASISEQVKTIRDGMTDEQKKMDGLDEETLTKILEEDTIAARYKTDMIKDFEIDYNKIKAGIKKEDYRQYALQYYYVSTKKTDDEGKSTDLPAAEKDKLKAEMTELQKKAKKAKDFTKLVEENNKSDIQYNTNGLLDTDTTFISEKHCADIKKMKNGAITGVLEGDDGFYIVKMENNNSEEAYNNAVTQANQTEEQNQFATEYATLVSDGYEVIKNQSQWDRIKMGTITIDDKTETENKTE